MGSLISKKENTSGLARSERIRALISRAKQLTQSSKISNFLEICFAFDTTGSMHPVFKAGQEAIREIMDEIKKSTSAKMAFIAYKNHGDEKYFDSEKPFAATPWTDDPTEFQFLMNQIPNAGGGDGLTALEDVFRYVGQNMVWDPNSAKALVIVGDMPPHGVLDSVSRCSLGIDYRQEIRLLKNLGIKVYAIYCDTDIRNVMGKDRKQKTQNFYHWIAQETGGKCLSLEDIRLLVTILLGICMKEANRFDEFVATLSKRKQLGPGEQKVIRALKGS